MDNISSRILISIIINCHNGEKYLAKTINSVIEQTYENWEIIFWNNRSTDNSARIAQSYLDSRIKYYMAPNYTSLGKARNLAMKKATGEWCAFLDSDDTWVSDKLSKQIDIINRNQDVGVVYGQMMVCKENIKHDSIWSEKMRRYTQKTMMKKLPEGDIFNQLLKINFIPLLTAIFKKDLFFQAGGISEHMEIAEDYDLFIKLSRITNICAVQDVVAFYRVHDSNLSIERQEQGFLEVLEIVDRYLPDENSVQAMRIHQTIRSIQQIREGDVLKGSLRFFLSGSFFSIAYVLFKRFSY